MAHYNVAVLGCGAIFSRHLAALESNNVEYNFIGYFDPNIDVQNRLKLQLPNQVCYKNELEILTDKRVDCIVILTPSNLHYQQAKAAILAGKHVIVEKPVAFTVDEIKELEFLATQHSVEINCILQVRLNQSVTIVKQVIEANLLGEIRSCSLVQRWQRPIDYFSGWRGSYEECGGVLFEFGIHYLDILQYLLGLPKVIGASFYNTKFKNSKVADSVYSLIDFGTFGGTVEVCLTTEPKNIEVSLVIWGSNGFVKLSGKSLDQIEDIQFATVDAQVQYANICQKVLGYPINNQVAIGACPHHPELYRRIIDEKQLFNVAQTINVIQLINSIHSFR